MIEGFPIDIWQIAGDPTDENYMEALHFWSRHAELLPAPLFFTIPKGANMARWRGLMSRSEAMCPCGARRLITPTMSTALFDESGTMGPLSISSQTSACLTYWGGDRQSTLMALSVKGDRLVTRHMPFSGKSAEVLAAEGLRVTRVASQPKLFEDSQGNVNLSFEGEDINPLEHDATLNSLVHRLQETVDIPQFCNFGSTGRDIWSVPYVITKVDESAGIVTIIASAWFKVIDPSLHEPLHSCL